MKNIFRGFKTWLRRQPCNRQFVYSQPKGCVLASFLKDKGVKDCLVGPRDVLLAHGEPVFIPEAIARALHAAVEDFHKTLNASGYAIITPKMVLKHL